jgi:microsomal dipeptidase-like Zn-dependent dipeptidase
MKLFLRIFFTLVLIGLIYFFFFVAKSVDKSRNTTDLVNMPEISEKAKVLHQSLIIADWHADPLLWDRDLLKRINYGQIDVPRLIEGNITLQVFGVVTKSPSGQNYESNETNAFDNITPLAIGNRWPVKTWFNLQQRALYQAERLYRTAEKSDGKLVVVTSKDELAKFLLKREKNKNMVGGVLSLEGTHALYGSLTNFINLYDAGFRVFGMTHFFDNEAGGSSAGRGKQGLTEFGKDLVSQIEEKSGIIDLAHASPRLIDDVLEKATRPVIISHTGVKAVSNSPRNLSDEQILKITNKGGLIGVGYWDEAAGDITPQGIAKTIRHLADLAGIDHISLGSDFDGSVHTYFDVSKISLLTEALLQDGFTEDEIRKIMGGNQIDFLLSNLP